MPKRDETYMEAQRDAIARAALDVLIEKGYYETSLRDICRAANISNGALYSYFPTRESVILAACAIDHALAQQSELPSSWEEYVAILSHEMVPGTYRSQRFRLSLQFVAELSQMKDRPEGASVVYQIYRANLSRCLLALKERGIIALPLGLEPTTDLHSQLFTGIQYQLALNRGTALDAAVEAFRTGLAVTAGLIQD